MTRYGELIDGTLYPVVCRNLQEQRDKSLSIGYFPVTFTGNMRPSLASALKARESGFYSIPFLGTGFLEIPQTSYFVLELVQVN